MLGLVVGTGVDLPIPPVEKHPGIHPASLDRWTDLPIGAPRLFESIGGEPFETSSFDSETPDP